ncbi:S8 family serine peptidase [Microbacterium sp. M3]|uniref:S8 family serine peptidase n=1 Tax=Microbacterium arthrosphaerae TaxID=792652 RepID=A0ABU4H4T3_9MICO|nr:MULTISPECIES: S8 family serine peptidase [Microbacterium]MDW4574352.1 S8 family serine peptidase [Microbacterium arthrosphaerae]MDW7608207.1 S8 family serine peptidase [Microbacterium sp. M3]
MNNPAPVGAEDGRYIVLLKEAPLAAYEGGTSGLQRTKPDKGAQLDAHSPNSKKYLAHLKKQQADVAAEVGATPDTTYGVTVNGFSAQLTGEQVDALSTDKNVLGVFPDEIYHPTAAVPSTEFIGLGSVDTGTGGVWDAVGGVAEAGKGIVVGVIDTGIAPENPSFAGDKLKKKSGTGEPYTEGGDTIVFDKADGGQFRSPITIGQSWNKHNYNTKLIGAQYFSEGAKASGFDFSYDYLSPRDGDGHGSHTAGTAAGNFGVDASVEGIGFGKISGVAPAAKVSAYKACYVGPDDLVTSDDICAGSDLIAAIDKAVEDGVDVINYSIGGGSASSILSADDYAFLGAAAAGVFVSVSAGNDGPGAATADHGSPWYTTVAASTVPTYEGTVQLPNGFQAAGASVTVPFGESLSGPVVYAGDIKKADAAQADAELCFLGTLDPAKAAGKIVVCDRGANARVEKSQEVAAAGGTAMILVNKTPGSLDNDFHSVPTVHIDAQHRDALLEYVRGTAGATATLVGDNVTGVETPTPQIAGFSSRGPILADGSDVIKPDVSAPGVAIIAATHNGPKEAATFGFKSGTSMSSPHVAGLGALYLGEDPDATPAQIKSALMTTAYDLVDASGDPVADTFAQGAGHVDPKRYFQPGLLYLNDTMDWLSYIEGALGADYWTDAEPMDPSDLNLASIGVGALAGTQTITREVTATTAGTFTASVDLPGVDAVVSPSSFTIAAGETQAFTVTFTNATAPVEEWTTGFLTWTGADTTVRSPIAVFPVTADAPPAVSGEGADGSVDVTVTPGFTGDLPLNVFGLAKDDVLIDGDETTGADTDGLTKVLVQVPEGVELARFALNSSVDTAGTDLDLTVKRVVSDTDLRYYQAWQSATGSADEAVQIPQPTAGWYLIEADVFAFTGPFTWTATSALVTDGGLGSLTATPGTLAAEQATPTTYNLSWSGLESGTYLGVVRYGDSDVRTVVSVDVP